MRTHTRPGSVTVVVVLTWIYALMMILAGALWLFAAGDGGFVADVDGSATDARVYGWSVLALGVVALLTAIGLGAGSRLARFLIIAIMVLRIGVDVLGLVGISGYPVWQALLSIAWALLIISMLSTRRAARWFLDH